MQQLLHHGHVGNQLVNAVGIQDDVHISHRSGFVHGHQPGIQILLLLLHLSLLLRQFFLGLGQLGFRCRDFSLLFLNRGHRFFQLIFCRICLLARFFRLARGFFRLLLLGLRFLLGFRRFSAIDGHCRGKNKNSAEQQAEASSKFSLISHHTHPALLLIQELSDGNDTAAGTDSHAQCQEDNQQIRHQVFRRNHRYRQHPKDVRSDALHKTNIDGA